jgi:glycosyltransferase involved in cell wall biosynthesis
MHQPPKVLWCSDDPGLGGVAQYNHALLCALARRGWAVTSAQSHADTPEIRHQAELGVRHAWIGFDTSADFARALHDIDDARRILGQHHPDIVVFSNGCPLSNLAAQRAALEAGLPFVVVEGFADASLAQRFADHLDELARHYQHARAVVAVSEHNLRVLRESFRLPPDKGQVIRYGRPPEFFAPVRPDVRRRLRTEWGADDGDLVCLCAARLDPVKGHHIQLEALRRLHGTPALNRLRLVWAGDGPLRDSLTAAARDLGLEGRVTFLGRRRDVADCLDAADAFVLTSLAEGMPLAIMEAMAKALPVCATAVGGVPEQLGDDGRLLPDPRADPEGAADALAATLAAWADDPDARRAEGQTLRRRAEIHFREERMVAETLHLLDRAALPPGDYVAPGLAVVRPDACFPNVVRADPRPHPWPYLRREIPHAWYVDRRWPIVGLLSRDEALLLHNAALPFRGRRALEIGCFVGWSTCHLALAGVDVDGVDPLLAQPVCRESITASLRAADVLSRVRLVAGRSPEAVEQLATREGLRWPLFFIDGSHEGVAPLRDAVVCERFAEPDAMMLFHDLACPDVAAALAYLQARRWNVRVYHTMQIMAAAWRGNVQPVRHEPDPTVRWQLPEHLKGFPTAP